MNSNKRYTGLACWLCGQYTAVRVSRFTIPLCPTPHPQVNKALLRWPHFKYGELVASMSTANKTLLSASEGVLTVPVQSEAFLLSQNDPRAYDLNSQLRLATNQYDIEVTALARVREILDTAHYYAGYAKVVFQYRALLTCPARNMASLCMEATLAGYTAQPRTKSYAVVSKEVELAPVWLCQVTTTEKALQNAIARQPLEDT